LAGILRLNLRLRIAVVLATVSITIVGALGITLYMASEDMEDALVEQLVDEELESLIVRSRSEAARVVASGPNLEYHVLRTPGEYKDLAPSFRGLGPGHHNVGTGGDEKHVAIRDVAGVRYLVAYDAGPHELREARFRYVVLLALATAVVVSALLGYWLAGVLTRQLTELAQRVGNLAPGEEHERLQRPDHDAEVAALAGALDQYHARIVEMIAREQEFTANASHELRTPLTAIRTSCELLGSARSLSEKERARVEMIAQAAEQMTDRIEALLYLARQRPAEPVEAVALRDCVDEAAAPYRDEIARKGLRFEAAIPEHALVKLDRKALQLVLVNLIKNAVRYTEAGYVRVTYEAPRLTVADSGAGIAPNHLPQVFERFYRGDQSGDGLGLGLAIVRRICDDLGWKIEVESKRGAGSSFSIVLA
jgi:signal transduction histidine kinase